MRIGKCPLAENPQYLPAKRKRMSGKEPGRKNE
jgi:hypothetical protein